MNVESQLVANFSPSVQFRILFKKTFITDADQ